MYKCEPFAGTQYLIAMLETDLNFVASSLQGNRLRLGIVETVLTVLLQQVPSSPSLKCFIRDLFIPLMALFPKNSLLSFSIACPFDLVFLFFLFFSSLPFFSLLCLSCIWPLPFQKLCSSFFLYYILVHDKLVRYCSCFTV